MYGKFITINYIVCVRLYLPLRSLVANSVSCRRAIYPNFMWFLFVYIFIHICIHARNYRVIAWRHLLHWSKLSAINDSFSHIAFSISITFERILYMRNNTIYIYTACIKTLNKSERERRHLLRIGEFHLWFSQRTNTHELQKSTLSKETFVIPRCYFQIY